MTAPIFNILTQKELTIDLSRPSMHILIDMLQQSDWQHTIQQCGVECELDNFINTLQNLMERSEPKPENSDLIGD
jgi:hypothetical protein